jgi:hypothetical protein
MQPLEQRIVRAIESANAPPVTKESLLCRCAFQHVEAETAEHAATGSKHEAMACDVVTDEINTKITCAFAEDDDASRFEITNGDHGLKLVLYSFNKAIGREDVILKSYNGAPRNLHAQLKEGDLVNLKLKFPTHNLRNGEPHGWALLEFGRRKGTPWVKTVIITVPTELVRMALEKLAQ